MSSNTDTTTAGTAKKTTSGRLPLPSLNQLAARINKDTLNGSVAAPSSVARPRLVASVLRTGSSASLSTTASNADSLAVNAPSTRSVSPAGTSDTPPKSTTPVNDSGVEPLTTERLEKLNQETVDDNVPAVSMPPPAELPKKKVGYKNIPSLDTLARLVKARATSLSIDGSAMPPEPPMIEDPKTPGVPMKAPEHPLQFSWTIYHDTKAKFPFPPNSAAGPGSAFNQPPPGQSSTPVDPPYSAAHPPEGAEYEAGLTIIGEFCTVEEFCRYFNWLKPPSKLEKNSNYHIFKSGIKPMWEDPANANGGKWVLTMKNNPALLDRCWSWLAMALVGEELEEGDEICGAVVSLRTKVDRIQLWTRSKDDVEKLNAIGKKLVKLLDVSEADNIGLEFQFNSDDRPPVNKFLSIQSMPVSSFRSSFQGPPGASQPAAAASRPVSAEQGAGTFGGFGTGVGIGAQPWKSTTTKRT